jgi:predicted amidohydrolase
MTSKELVTLQFTYDENDYEGNLEKLISLIKESSKDSIVVAPELCLTNFSFGKLDEAAEFSKEALKKIKELFKDRVISLSVIDKRDGKFYNSAKIIANNKIIHSQDKVKLFRFGDEDKFYQAGSKEKVKIVEINGLRFAILICFEIRFIELWNLIQGADIIMIPALWGKLRKEQLEAITKSMAIINQAFVIVSNSSQENMASSSAIISPFGEVVMDDTKEFIKLDADLSELKKMRRYMDIGLK